MATVELKGLHKRFGKTEVIRDVNLTIEDGEEHVAHPRGEARILVVEDINSE